MRMALPPVVKHWVGYGAQPNGFDAHNYYGRFAKLSDASFAQHVAAFQGALEAHAAGVMPAYPILQGVTVNGKPRRSRGARATASRLLDGAAARSAPSTAASSCRTGRSPAIAVSRA